MPGEILTIGHSNHPIDLFLKLLKQHKVEVVVDTRSQPSSKYSPQYDGRTLKKVLIQYGIRYLYLGKELGGRPAGKEFYDSEGHVLYSLVAKTPLFVQGIERLEKGIQHRRVVLLCSEESPAGCHRRLLVGRVLLQRGTRVDHIRGDGRLETEEDVVREQEKDYPAARQLTLFEQADTLAWRSIPSVLPKKRLSNSSGR